MNRKDLLSKLEATAPALAGNDLIPIYQCFVFKGEQLMAYNDSMAILTAIEEISDFAVNGKTLLGLLQNSGADEVTFSLKDDLIIKAGKSTFKLPYFKPDEFLFEEPNEKWLLKLPITEKLLNGLKVCLMTSASEEHMKKIAGVCINADEDAMYSCDGDAITSYTLGKRDKGSFLLSNDFCQQLLRFSGEGALSINQTWACANLKEYTLYGRLPDIGEPYDYAGQLEGTLPEGGLTRFDIPEGLSAALARARVIADIESAPTHLKVAGGKLELTTSTHMGDINDLVSFKGHPDIEVDVHASLMHRSIEICKKMTILENCTVYEGDDVFQVVANIGE